MDKKEYTFDEFIEELSALGPVDFVSGDAPVEDVVKFCIDCLTIIKKGKDLNLKGKERYILASTLKKLGCGVKLENVNKKYLFNGVSSGRLVDAAEHTGTIDYPISVLCSLAGDMSEYVMLRVQQGFCCDGGCTDTWLDAQGNFKNAEDGSVM